MKRKTADVLLPEQYLTPVELAHLLAVPVQTLYLWRSKGIGPPGFRIGRHVRYDPKAVRCWIDELGEGAA
jgi:predicted DNA-binding transcriptional regulator AlpA